MIQTVKTVGKTCIEGNPCYLLLEYKLVSPLRAQYEAPIKQ